MNHGYLDLTALVARRGAILNRAPQAIAVLAWVCLGLILAVDLTLAWR